MQSQPENSEQILNAYAEACHSSFIRGNENTIYALQYPEKWKQNCKIDAVNSIANNRDSWERISKVAEEFNKNNPEFETYQFIKKKFEQK